jgi:hypothetical protein
VAATQVPRLVDKHTYALVARHRKAESLCFGGDQAIDLCDGSVEARDDFDEVEEPGRQAGRDLHARILDLGA